MNALFFVGWCLVIPSARSRWDHVLNMVPSGIETLRDLLGQGESKWWGMEKNA
jgi:hypothetical protein